MIAISRCPEELQRILTAAEKQDLVLRAPKGDELLLSLIDDFDYEIAAQRRNPKLMAFLKERFRRARKKKGIPLQEVRRRLGLLSNSQPASRRRQRPVLMTIDVSKRSQPLLDLLEQGRSDDVILKANRCECFVAAIPDGDYMAANRRRSEVVMAYLDEQGDRGDLPPLEVVFLRERPRKLRARREEQTHP